MGVFSGEGDNVAVAAAPPPEPAPIPQAEETPGEAVAPGANGTSPPAVPANAPAVPDGAPVVLTASEDDWIKVYDKSQAHTSELQSLMRISYAVFCLKKQKQPPQAPQMNPQRENQTNH